MKAETETGRICTFLQYAISGAKVVPNKQMSPVQYNLAIHGRIGDCVFRAPSSCRLIHNKIQELEKEILDCNVAKSKCDPSSRLYEQKAEASRNTEQFKITLQRIQKALLLQHLERSYKLIPLYPVTIIENWEIVLRTDYGKICQPRNEMQAGLDELQNLLCIQNPQAH